jgi:hypothetical protein
MGDWRDSFAAMIRRSGCGLFDVRELGFEKPAADAAVKPLTRLTQAG